MEINMFFLFCVQKKDKGKIFTVGNTLNILCMSSCVCQYAAERVAGEKGISEDAAMKFVLESIWESFSIKHY